MERVKKKICLLGDPSVGKTSLIRRYVLNSFDEKYLSTLGTHVSKKEIVYRERDLYLDAMIWDIAGQKEMKRTQATGLRNSAGVILVGDLSRPDTIGSANEWQELIKGVAGDIPILYILNKADLVPNQIEVNRLKDKIQGQGMIPIVASAKTGKSVESAFIKIGQMVLPITTPRPIHDKQLEKVIDRDTPKTVMEAEDEIIGLFVELFGDEPLAMSVVRQQFKKRGVDFRSATIQDLDRLIEDLMITVGPGRPPDDIKFTKKAMIAVLNSIKQA